jgi:hypothetical protein
MTRRSASALMQRADTPTSRPCMHCDLKIEQADIPANHPGRGTKVWVHTRTQNIWCQSHLLDAGLSMAFAEPR